MKKLLAWLLTFAMILSLMPAAFAEDEIAGPVASEIDTTVTDGRNELDFTLLRDGHDDTGYTFKRGSSFSLTLTLAEGDNPLAAVYCRLTAMPKTVTLRVLNSNRKYETVATLSAPGSEFVISCEPMIGQIQLVLDYASSTPLTLTEMRLFGEGDLPSSLHAFTVGGQADILYVVPDTAHAAISRVADLVAQGRTVQVLVMSAPAEGVNDFNDRLWDAGVHTCAAWGDLKEAEENLAADKLAKQWPTSSVQKLLANAIRRYKPQLVLWNADGTVADYLAQALDTAAANAVDYNFETDSGSSYGLWLADTICQAGTDEAEAFLSNWQDDGADALRTWCADQFADAQHGDVSSIPYPDNRQEDGYLPEGSDDWVYEDSENGLWAYLSATVQIQIVRYEQPDIPRVWFVSDVQFKPDQEQFHQQLFTAASFAGQMTYPETLAQNAKLVFGINGDYYLYRENSKTMGNILRSGVVLYNMNKNKTMAYPNLDCVALRNDGSLSVYAGSEITADELLAEGDVHDVLSFGPYLVRDGVLRLYNGNSWDATEPRNALGMVSPGHYKVITVEGRFAKGVGPAGVNLNMLAEMMYAQGVTDALNLDGGSTSVLIFMGEKINRTASKSGKSETNPRNMSELFGVGTSDLVHTDKLNGVE